MPQRSSRRVTVVSGCWVGSVINPDGGSDDLIWALALTPSTTKRPGIPSAFGGAPGGTILRGSWTAESRTALFTEYSVQSPSVAKRSFQGFLDRDDRTMKGTFICPNGGRGSFACRLETSSDGSEAGLFIGALVPEGDFAEFIPTNPLYWVLAALTPEAAAAAGGCPQIFGAGFFSDAGGWAAVWPWPA